MGRPIEGVIFMSFILDEKTLFSFPEKANNEALIEIFGNFTHEKFKNVKFSSDENVIMIGEGEAADKCNGQWHLHQRHKLYKFSTRIFSFPRRTFL